MVMRDSGVSEVTLQISRLLGKTSVFVCVCVYVCSLCVEGSMYVHLYVCMYVCMCVCVCVCVCVHALMCVYASV